jgi:hypothetical protein
MTGKSPTQESALCWNPDTPEGLGSWPSVGIHRIPAELSHSTELEIKNSIEPEQILVELPRSSYSKDSRQARKSSSPQNLTSPLSLLYKNELRSTIGG